MKSYLALFKRALASSNRAIEQEDAPSLAGIKHTHQFVPPGHFYSPLPSIAEIRENADKIFTKPRTLPGIDLNEDEQLQMFGVLSRFYDEMPFQGAHRDGLRFHFENSFYAYADAICLYAMIRHLQPRRIIEIGSGFSSCVTLDTNELFCANSIACTFIEPHPQNLLSLIKQEDRDRVRIIPTTLQDVPLEEFSALGPRDILFIDSTHVSKVNSDVNRIFFEILPRLAGGVHVHFHDIFFPFEYPQTWICDLGITWNESYLLRAFLQFNDHFKIVFFTTFLEHFYEELFVKAMPLCLKNRGGSIWLRKS